jgi:hypothetical protein
MKKLLILTLCLLQLSTMVKSQEINSSNNLSLEFGLGYNTLGWDVKSLQGNINNDRNQFLLFPSFKLKYSIPLTNFDNNSIFEVTPFVGYNMFGGKSKKESNGYKDIIFLQSLEIGALPTFSLNNKLSLYGGLKGQYIFSAKQKSYGTVLSPIETEREWETSDANELFKDISFNLGAGFNYKLDRFSLGLESWFGITNLSDYEEIRTYENNYRLIIGYRIK